jgi:cation transport protein ChaC
MSPLTRSALRSGSFLQSFAGSHETPWSSAQIACSLQETLQRRPPSSSNDVWVFGYGSLMWNPALDFEERRTAVLRGWHRSFCLRMVSGRGSPSVPGRMLALERGGLTYGVALRLPARTAAEELPLVWTREMVFGAYRPTWTAITFGDGTSVSAITFAADPSRPQYLRDASVDAVAPAIASATGPFGSNAEYVFSLREALARCGARDPYIEAVAEKLDQLDHLDRGAA